MEAFVKNLITLILITIHSIVPSKHHLTNHYTNTKINVCYYLTSNGKCKTKSYILQQYIKSVLILVYFLSVVEEVDPYLVLSLIKVESNFKSEIISKKGAVGLCQILPKGVASNGYNQEQLRNPTINLDSCVKYLKLCLKTCNNNLDSTISCFKTGKCNRNPNSFYIYLVKYWYNFFRHLNKQK